MKESLESHLKHSDAPELSERQVSGLLHYFGLYSRDSVQELVQGIKVLAQLQK